MIEAIVKTVLTIVLLFAVLAWITAMGLKGAVQDAGEGTGGMIKGVGNQVEQSVGQNDASPASGR